MIGIIPIPNPSARCNRQVGRVKFGSRCANGALGISPKTSRSCDGVAASLPRDRARRSPMQAGGWRERQRRDHCPRARSAPHRARVRRKMSKLRVPDWLRHRGTPRWIATGLLSRWRLHAAGFDLGPAKDGPMAGARSRNIAPENAIQNRARPGRGCARPEWAAIRPACRGRLGDLDAIAVSRRHASRGLSSIPRLQWANPAVAEICQR
jgi:hypothetical protein